VGFDFVALGQHRFTPEAVNSSALLTVLSGLAARTSRLTFVTSTLILGLYNWVDFAEEAATSVSIDVGQRRL
jgi:alkanesulfonate monooxygenase SsuD/methylene tetrahydromethanopterin reductase-like flavin-dependent oxidoreductase (luciferase family)